MTNFKQIIISFTGFIIVLILPSFAGHAPNPITVERIGDSKLSCASLRNEINEIQNNITIFNCQIIL